MPYALVDCCNFYVSCERLFAPALRGVPVAVLSNNDGCIIARSDEVKALGIPMGAPYFKHRAYLEGRGVRVFSSNYALYGDLSRRVMETLQTFTDEVEVYSIDEAFLRLPGWDTAALEASGQAIHDRVRRWTGIPTRVGVGATKTLAKVASLFAKRQGAPVFALAGRSQREHDRLLETIPVGDVWGIGRRQGPKLHALGIETARKLRDQPDDWVRRRLTVVGLRTVYELRGVSCLPLALAPTPRKSITHSRSFGRAVTRLSELSEALASYTSRAAEKLRRSALATRLVQVFLTTGKHAERPYSASTLVRLERETSATPPLLGAAKAGLAHLYRPGFAYKKCGVTLLELVPEEPEQGHLFIPRDPKTAALMDAVDYVNRRLGRGAVFFAAAGTRRQVPPSWQGQRNLRSPSYTTCWAELPQLHT